MDDSTTSKDHKIDQQFWVDLTEENVTTTYTTNYFSHFLKGYTILTFIFIALIPIYLIWHFTGPVFAIAFIAIIILPVIYGFYIRRHRQTELKRKERIQERACALIGTDTVGSAIHVAGHPLFERDQPVVLALKNDELSIYTYQNRVPIDVVDIKTIKAIYTVVYDDDRIPYIDVIDNTAQALQLMVSFQGKDFNCLFRRFRRLKAIDWYHELQKAKFRQ
jgi:hypothetical protein